MKKYILDKHGIAIHEPDLITWGIWFDTADRKIEKTIIDDVTISTVFLGIDHAFGGEEPILFETMIFGGAHDGYQNRANNIIEARKQHEKAIKLIQI